MPGKSRLLELIQESDSEKISSSRVLMLTGGLLFAGLTASFAVWLLALALPRVLSGAWTATDSQTLSALIGVYRHALTLSASLAAPYVARRLGSGAQDVYRSFRSPIVTPPGADPIEDSDHPHAG